MEADASRIAGLLDGRQLAVAESLTCGRVAHLFADVEGSTQWFRGGLTAWQREAKYRLLGVPEGSPVVTGDAAGAMAAGAARLFGTEAAVATTGAAGPQGMDGAQPGTVFVATCVEGAVDVTELHLSGSPPEICEQAAAAALHLTVEALARQAALTRRA